MSLITFEPQSTSTPKKINTTPIQNLCSTPRPIHFRYSLSKCAPLPIDSSTPIARKSRKSLAPSMHHLMYPSNTPTAHSMKIWVL
ncbi:unnamed protein product [Rotaria socialis]|uniref:Uncharacterized protein n=1 Tax=Rotaria socialis TaxID=392032 RepID=A0A821RKQ6_9BILA|nr:unnamed protein product [Rotaria socialis]CAF3329074.1 unnamed protein product [Rotaria socialis]CAF3363000.1 unnamed protein product [Rotaria socialis]CAF3404417.1 unnamed protein product [Rotaria socialis]CAF3509259.1 unnamed protein product [Rotaria socialis]